MCTWMRFKIKRKFNHKFLIAGVQKISRQPTVSVRIVEVHNSISQTSYFHWDLIFPFWTLLSTESPHTGLVCFRVCVFSSVVPQKQKYLLFSILEEARDTACMCALSHDPNPPHKASSKFLCIWKRGGGGRRQGRWRLHIVPWGQIKALCSPLCTSPTFCPNLYALPCKNEN